MGPQAAPESLNREAVGGQGALGPWAHEPLGPRALPGETPRRAWRPEGLEAGGPGGHFCPDSAPAGPKGPFPGQITPHKEPKYELCASGGRWGAKKYCFAASL